MNTTTVLKKTHYNTQLMNRNTRHIIALAITLLLCSVALAQEPTGVTIGGSVFGGGNLNTVAGNTSVLIEKSDAVVTGDVYGGGALADVGTVAGESSATTHVVDILDGHVNGNVYGGGLGQKASTGVEAIAASVNGTVEVNIGKAISGSGFATTVSGEATILGSVYGCNNLNGSPKDNVTVNIYKTAHDEKNAATYTESDRTYALAAVYGGGNQAHYEPAADKQTTVHVWTCDNTIEYLYGGGNAANVGNSTTNSAAELIIDGGRILWVFGGGNGYSSTDNHTDPTQPNYNPGAYIYGNATSTFHGGYINYFFGGSNEYGEITGEKIIDIQNDNTSCSTTNHIVELYGGNNKAPINNNMGVTLNMPCPTGTPCQIDYLFGGSRDANISGNVTLTVLGGLYNYVFAGNNIGGIIDGDVTLNLLGGTINEAAFGGNNEGGSINGKITVNMMKDNTACAAGLIVHNIYGGDRKSVV